MALAVLAASAPSVLGQGAPPFAVEDAVSMKRFAVLAPIQLSPDGQWVAYSVIDARSRGFSTRKDVRTDRGVPQVMNGSEVWVAEVSSGAMRWIGGGKNGGSAWGVSWSPDGRSLAYLSDDDGEVALWVWSRTSGRARRVSRAVVRPGQALGDPKWTPDGRSVVVKTARQVARWPDTGSARATGNAPRIERFVFRPDSPDARLDTRETSRVVAAWYMSDLSAIDGNTGAARTLARNEPIVTYWVSPTGESVAYTRHREDLRAGTHMNTYDLIVASLRDGTSRVVARGIPHTWGGIASWSPDGRRLAFLSAPSTPTDSSVVLPPGCYVVLANGDSLRSIGLARDFRAGGFDLPLWDHAGRFIYVVADGKLLRMALDGSGETVVNTPPDRQVLAVAARMQSGRLWSPDGGKHVLVVVRDTSTMRQGIARISLNGDEPHVMSEGDQSIVGGAASSAHLARLDAVGERLIVLRESASDPPDLWLFHGRGNEPRRVTRVNPALSRYRFGTGRLVTWLSDDGTPLRGVVILPPGYTPTLRYPLVVYVYGGAPLSMWGSTFGGLLPSSHDIQLFATRGYAVFLPDAPQQFGTPRFDLAKTVLPGVSRLVEMGIADGDRLAIFGHSYGGYSVYSLVTQTTRFRAAVVSAGMASLVTMYGAMTGGTGLEDAIENGQGKIGGSLWELRERFIENSPIFHFDRVRTPVLIVHGARDMAVPVWAADEAFVALRRLGREVEYVRYMDEEHADWTGPASSDMFARTLDFLSSHLKPRPIEAVGASGGGTQP